MELLSIDQGKAGINTPLRAHRDDSGRWWTDEFNVGLGAVVGKGWILR